MQNQRVAKILQGKDIPKVIAENLENDVLNYAKNCENIIGSIKIPIGIAGPILLNQKSYIIPLATTEAALVASINRGCKIVNLSEKLNLSVQNKGITRAPVYKIKKIKSLSFYKNWFNNNIENLQLEIAKTSRFTKIIKIEPKKYKGYLFVKFYFNTGDAMGMNMATIACENMNSLICTSLKAQCIALSSNFCSDKKPSLVNINDGRGYKTTAKLFLKNSSISEHLKCDPHRLFETYRTKIQLGSKLAKSICQNSHQANIIAAIFLATGQDAAHIAESSLGNTKLRKFEDGIAFKVEIPNLIFGTVGGGTNLATQKEAIDLIGLEETVETEIRTAELAKVITLAVLAGEISLLGSLSEGSLATTHDKYRK